MRPRRLEIEGFTAFRTKQEIDFTQLDLFVITGPTGAGKTSLLDAMALALYGQVPRMGKQGLGQLVSHGSAEARVLLEFESGGERLQVARRQPRRGAQSARIERFDGERWVDIAERGGVRAVNEAVLERVKLDFDSFCKAVVLPQGEFARFLKGDAAERRTTLVTLLGLNAYEQMAKLARGRARELVVRGDQTRTILAEQYADATAETLTVAEAEVVTAAAAAELVAKRLDEGRAHERARVEAVSDAATAAGFATRLRVLGEDLGAEVARCRAAEASAAGAAVARGREGEAVTAVLALLASADAAVTALRERAGTREALGRLIHAAERRPSLDERVTEAERGVAAVAARIVELSAALEKTTSDAAAATQAVSVAAADETRLREAAETLSAERAGLVRLAQDAEKAAATVVRAQATVDGAAASAAAADVVAEAAALTLADAEETLATLHRVHTVAGLVVGLAVGDPCPVCERPLASHPPVDDDVAERLAAADASCATACAAAGLAREERSGARGQLELAEGRLTDARAALAEVLSEHADRAGLEAAAAESTVRAEAAGSALTAVTTTLTRLRGAEGTANVALEAAKNHLEAARGDQVTRRQLRTTALDERDSVDALLRSRFGETIPGDVLDQLTAARAELVVAETAAEEARSSADVARGRQREADEAHAQAEKALNAIDLHLGTLRTRVETTLDEVHRGTSPPALARIPEPAPARDEWASALAGWCDVASAALASAGAGSSEAAERAGAALVVLASAGAPAGAPVPAAADALAALVRDERAASELHVQARTAAKHLEQRVQQRAQLEAEVAADSELIAVLEVLARELRADHFIDFVVQETLDILALRASEELHRISDGRYSLVSADAQFSVVDHVNADEQRSVRTLSGGETFMASLSLALALSKHVSELAGEGLGARLEAVFIDEGFGTLDPETLSEVIDALERLREDELIIGVISHVPALAERIGVGLEVRKEGNRSVIVEATQ
ncbi:SMC family ATPase [Solirubrobacter ginsenosidimutans]|uniref:Nuclease SbcCD subunit C n=1 Tax=Solirubrobacter ginsenosidimutans TaxID=490573 RepID=A0A9X3MPR2_9ACTN|nr:SMC family ATPase [Solirubrobacter ginsenosidimutans]MDA0160596.1 SMC family ATPase [Solirubrobacter ginsenosidimutans]